MRGVKRGGSGQFCWLQIHEAERPAGHTDAIFTTIPSGHRKTAVFEHLKPEGVAKPETLKVKAHGSFNPPRNLVGPFFPHSGLHILQGLCEKNQNSCLEQPGHRQGTPLCAERGLPSPLQAQCVPQLAPAHTPGQHRQEGSYPKSPCPAPSSLGRGEGGSPGCSQGLCWTQSGEGGGRVGRQGLLRHQRPCCLQPPSWSPLPPRSQLFRLGRREGSCQGWSSIGLAQGKAGAGGPCEPCLKMCRQCGQKGSIRCSGLAERRIRKPQLKSPPWPALGMLLSAPPPPPRPFMRQGR